jgi:hypothetical protein
MDIYDRAHWANPDNYYHDEYQLAWLRRFWVLLAALTLGTGALVPGMAWVIPLVPLVMLALSVLCLALLAVAYAGLVWLPEIRDWLNGR